MQRFWFGLLAMGLLLGCAGAPTDSNSPANGFQNGSLSYVGEAPSSAGETFSIQATCPTGGNCDVLVNGQLLGTVEAGSQKVFLIEENSWSNANGNLAIKLIGKTNQVVFFTLNVKPTASSSGGDGSGGGDNSGDGLTYYNCDSPDLLNASFAEVARDYYVAQKCAIGGEAPIPGLIGQFITEYEKKCILALDEGAFQDELSNMEANDKGDSCVLYQQFPEVSASMKEKIEGWKSDFQSRIDGLTDKTVDVFVPFGQ